MPKFLIRQFSLRLPTLSDRSQYLLDCDRNSNGAILSVRVLHRGCTASACAAAEADVRAVHHPPVGEEMVALLAATRANNRTATQCRRAKQVPNCLPTVYAVAPVARNEFAQRRTVLHQHRAPLLLGEELA